MATPDSANEVVFEGDGLRIEKDAGGWFKIYHEGCSIDISMRPGFGIEILNNLSGLDRVSARITTDGPDILIVEALNGNIAFR